MRDEVDSKLGSKLSERARGLFATANRGFLLDLFVFFLNFAVMAALTRLLVEAIRRSASGDLATNIVLFLAGAALFVLAPLGATLKRWHIHQRLGEKAAEFGKDPMGSCLFNPIFYFCLTAVIFAGANAFVLQSVYGRQEPPGGIFVGSILGGIVLMVVHTALVYRYFSPPKAPPRAAFLRSPLSGVIGDICLFLNMVLFQLIWNLLAMSDLPRTTGVSDFFFRFLIVAFLALLIYFPPRMFYLAEDIRKRRTWVMIVLANVPILVRVLWGTGVGW